MMRGWEGKTKPVASFAAQTCIRGEFNTSLQLRTVFFRTQKGFLFYVHSLSPNPKLTSQNTRFTR